MTTEPVCPPDVPAFEPTTGLPPDALGLYQAGCLVFVLAYLLLFTPWL